MALWDLVGFERIVHRVMDNNVSARLMLLSQNRIDVKINVMKWLSLTFAF